jgi:hypothetical protein
MKHAFIFATNIFISNHRTFSFNDGTNNLTFLTIHNFYAPNQQLTIDASIDTVDDHHPVKVTGNVTTEGADIKVVTEPNRVKIFHANHPEPILDVYQLDPHEYTGLSSHITNEIHSQHPDPIFTIKGNFKVAGVHIMIENEKMFIDHDSYANAVNNAHDGVVLSAEKVHH